MIGVKYYDKIKENFCSFLVASLFAGFGISGVSFASECNGVSGVTYDETFPSQTMEHKVEINLLELLNKMCNSENYSDFFNSLYYDISKKAHFLGTTLDELLNKTVTFTVTIDADSNATITNIECQKYLNVLLFPDEVSIPGYDEPIKVVKINLESARKKWPYMAIGIILPPNFLKDGDVAKLCSGLESDYLDFDY